MPVCFAVDSFNEMWCCGVNVPKLRAIIATVRNFARAAFTTFGVVVFCLLMSLSSPFLFKLWSVQAMDTCIAPAAPRPGGGRTPGPPRAAAARHGGQSPDLAPPERRESRAGCPRCRRPRNANLRRRPRERLGAHSGLSAARTLLLSQKHPSSQVLPERRSLMLIAPQPLCLAAGSRPPLLNHREHPASAGAPSAERARPSPEPRHASLRSGSIHRGPSFLPSPRRSSATSHPWQPAERWQRLRSGPGIPRQSLREGWEGWEGWQRWGGCEPRASFVLAGKAGVQADPPGKIAAGITQRGLLERAAIRC